MPFADLVRDGKLKKVRAAIDAGALPDTPLAELRLFPEYGSSPYTAFD
jgi:hypothetical protein